MPDGSPPAAGAVAASVGLEATTGLPAGRPGCADVVVIGAGWAGLAAAVELCRQGLKPTLLDAAPHPGGRARAVTLTIDGEALQVDNGQHLLVGAYHEVLWLVDLVHQESGQALRRMPMRLESVGGLSLVPSGLPAPWHLATALLRARGIAWPDRVALLRLMASLRAARWAVPEGETVAGLLGRLRQPASLSASLWEPLCVATLNTPLERACARTFAAVLRDTLGGRRADCDFLLPRSTLSGVLPDPATAWLASHGASLRWRCAARGLAWLGDRWQVDTAAGPIEGTDLLLAVPPVNAARLLTGVADANQLAELDGFEYEPIATVYLWWRAHRSPALPDWILLDEQPQRRWHGQWLFDRGLLGGWRCAAVVVSARGRQWLAALHDRQEGDARASPGASIAEQVASQLGLPAPDETRLIVDKRATFRCVPQRPRWRPDQLRSRAAGPWLAGDWLWPDYPATLESAVRSGLAAARGIAATRTASGRA